MNETASLSDPACITRPGFLWFKRRHHEPLKPLYFERRFPPWHIVLNAARVPYEGRKIEHFVPSICRHCGQRYFEPYRFGANESMSWRGYEELWPDEANRMLLEASE